MSDWSMLLDGVNIVALVSGAVAAFRVAYRLGAVSHQLETFERRITALEETHRRK